MPRFELLTAEDFIDNLKVVFETKYADALALIRPSEPLRGLQAINTARQAVENSPVLNLLPYGENPQMSQDGASISESLTILCEWEVRARVANSLARYIVRYVSAGRSVIYDMTDAELIGAIPQGQRAGLNWDVSTVRYAERYYEAENLFTQVGSFVLTISYRQGRNNDN
ncbi:MAG TPA: hypothetical protein VF297_05230 [Pyrinomonadaceae bacterium]